MMQETRKPRVLFILKFRDDSWGQSGYGSGSGLSSGLKNSASFVNNMLNDTGIAVSKLVQVQDNNCIDREVTQYKPTHVIIEAYWVVPEKFGVLTKLHPNVKWIIRNHSEIPFLANEGIAIEWTRKYCEYPNVMVSCNNQRCLKAFNDFIDPKKNVFLPNWYPITTHTTSELIREFLTNRHTKKTGDLHIACPGAIRPLKNQLIQAVAALQVGRKLKRKVLFYINASRLELKGDAILKNIRALFQDNPDGELIEVPWCSHADFKMLLVKMDCVMQVSYTETFNIVGADAVDIGIPLVSSSELSWSDVALQADPNNIDDIADKLETALTTRRLPALARQRLARHVSTVPSAWAKVL